MKKNSEPKRHSIFIFQHGNRIQQRRTNATRSPYQRQCQVVKRVPSIASSALHKVHDCTSRTENMSARRKIFLFERTPRRVAAASGRCARWTDLHEKWITKIKVRQALGLILNMCAFRNTHNTSKLLKITLKKK